MKKIQDFRIGNLIMDGGSLRKVDKLIYPDNINGVFFGGELGDYINPIPIAEEWLFKFGFKKISNDEYRIIGLVKNSDFSRNYSISPAKIDGLFDFIVYAPYATLCKLKYIHELQNTFYQLTGTELQLNELTE